MYRHVEFIDLITFFTLSPPQQFLASLGSIPGVGVAGGGGESSEVLSLPSAKIGKLIGKAGATIKDIQARGGARVKIDHEVRTLGLGAMYHHGLPMQHVPFCVTHTRDLPLPPFRPLGRLAR